MCKQIDDIDAFIHDILDWMVSLGIAPLFPSFGDPRDFNIPVAAQETRFVVIGQKLAHAAFRLSYLESLYIESDARELYEERKAIAAKGREYWRDRLLQLLEDRLEQMEWSEQGSRVVEEFEDGLFA